MKQPNVSKPEPADKKLDPVAETYKNCRMYGYESYEMMLAAELIEKGLIKVDNE